MKSLNHKFEIGRKYNHWTISSKTDRIGYIVCQCSCGVLREVRKDRLTNNDSKSCGQCLALKKDSFVGQKFGYLTIIDLFSNGKKIKAKCLCDCGNAHTITLSLLSSRGIKNCPGCILVKRRSNPKFIPVDIVKNIYKNWMVISNIKQNTWLCSCIACGNTKKIRKSDLESNKHIYCKKCNSTHIPFNFVGQKRGNWIVTKHLGENKWECVCDCPFRTVQILTSATLRKGTSKGCVSHQHNFVGSKFNNISVLEKMKNPKEWGYVYKCRCDCGRDMTLKTNIVANQKIKTCQPCALKRIQKETVGPNHPNWNPNISMEDRLSARDKPEDKLWRYEIYKKYQFTCQCCGSINQVLNAHHLKSYAKFPNLRYDLDNGICLCESCHKLFHILFSTHTFTKENFYWFQKVIKQLTAIENSAKVVDLAPPTQDNILSE